MCNSEINKNVYQENVSRGQKLLILAINLILEPNLHHKNRRTIELCNDDFSDINMAELVIRV